MNETRLNRRHLVFGTAAAALLGAARVSSAAAETNPNQALTDLLAMIPASAAPISSDDPQIAYFANIAAQLKAAGLTAPPAVNATSDEIKAYGEALTGLALPAFFDNFLSPDWVPTFGFNLVQVDQTLQAGTTPHIVTVLKGRFSKSDIGTALTKSGYKTIADPANAIWSLSEDESISLDKTANQLVLARFNNVAFTAGGMLIAAPRLDVLKTVLGLSAGTASLGANSEIAALVDAATTEFATAMFVTGDALIGRATSIKLVLTGLSLGSIISASGPGSGRNAVAESKWETLLLETDAEAAQARAKTIDAQLGSGESSVTREPYKSLFASWKSDVVPETSIVSVEITFAPGKAATVWLQAISARDVAWLGPG